MTWQCGLRGHARALAGLPYMDEVCPGWPGGERGWQMADHEPAMGRERAGAGNVGLPGRPRKEQSVVTVGILATLTAKPGMEQELASFLESALPLAEQEEDTTA